jgi:hypothetical protein
MIENYMFGMPQYALRIIVVWKSEMCASLCEVMW